ncbi:MAG: hypothetical protein ACW99A_10755 [Candidatus Kariarchaeaceae archaeon]|jgi:hypothetical protein
MQYWGEKFKEQWGRDGNPNDILTISYQWEGPEQFLISKESIDLHRKDEEKLTPLTIKYGKTSKGSILLILTIFGLFVALPLTIVLGNYLGKRLNLQAGWSVTITFIILPYVTFVVITWFVYNQVTETDMFEMFIETGYRIGQILTNPSNNKVVLFDMNLNSLGKMQLKGKNPSVTSDLGNYIVHRSNKREFLLRDLAGHIYVKINELAKGKAQVKLLNIISLYLVAAFSAIICKKCWTTMGSDDWGD